jgi:hypothetical protein
MGRLEEHTIAEEHMRSLGQILPSICLTGEKLKLDKDA